MGQRRRGIGGLGCEAAGEAGGGAEGAEEVEACGVHVWGKLGGCQWRNYRGRKGMDVREQSLFSAMLLGG